MAVLHIEIIFMKRVPYIQACYLFDCVEFGELFIVILLQRVVTWHCFLDYDIAEFSFSEILLAGV